MKVDLGSNFVVRIITDEDKEKARKLFNALVYRIAHKSNEIAVERLKKIPKYKEYLEIQANLMELNNRIEQCDNEHIKTELMTMKDITEDEVTSLQNDFRKAKNELLNTSTVDTVESKFKTYHFLQAIINGKREYI